MTTTSRRGGPLARKRAGNAFQFRLSSGASLRRDAAPAALAVCPNAAEDARFSTPLGSPLEARARWDAYTEAHEAALTTSTAATPWYVIPADRKWYRNLLITRIILNTLKAMNPQYPHVAFDPLEVELK
ncbi:hypothetical protein [Deinococcus kurensis]|uniref:hypothetical protein n=1 Tax=Deinococcus kurensis TaxID=2662757 RepID=UPI001F1B7577|nr:hypothetical protein [Deinococcus kurensis]